MKKTAMSMGLGLALTWIAGMASFASEQSFGVADTFIQKNRANKNYASSSLIKLRKHSSKAMVGFVQVDLSSVTAPITGATLRIYSDTQGGQVTATAINESVNISSLTWNTRPATGQSITTVNAGPTRWLEFDLGGFITSPGIWTVQLTSSQSTVGKITSANGGANKPEVVVTLDDGPTNNPPEFGALNLPDGAKGIAYNASLSATDPDGDPLIFSKAPSDPSWLSVSSNGELSGTPNTAGTYTFNFQVEDGRGGTDSAAAAITINETSSGGTSTFYVVEDTFVNKGRPNKTFASNLVVQVRSDSSTAPRRGYLQFDLSTLSFAPKSAKLLLYSASLNGSVEVYAVNTNPDIATLTWNNQPSSGNTAIGSANVTAGSTVEIDLSSHITAPGLYTLQLKTDSSLLGKLNSSEAGSNPPQLIVSGETDPKPIAKKPNILFIELDDLNYEFLGINGGPNSTPNIDRLARSGVRFANALAPGMMCGPSRNCFVSGLYPHNLGYYQNGQMDNLQRGVWTYPAALRRAGYYTAYIGKSHIHPYGEWEDYIDHFNNPLANELGFDYAPHALGRQKLVKKDRTDDNWYFNALKDFAISEGKNQYHYIDTFLNDAKKPTSLAEKYYLDGFYGDQAQLFIDAYDSEAPFLLWVNFSLPHGPADVAQHYHDQYTSISMPGAKEATFTPPAYLVAHATTLDPSDTNSLNSIIKTQRGHCANMAFMDEQVGQLVDALTRNDQLDDTIICFFSDHGLMMGDQYRRHKGTLFKAVTDPTLIISWPNGGVRENIVINESIELQDLIPTVLELAEASEADRTARPRHCSLMPLITGTGTFEREIAFTEIHEYVVALSNDFRMIKGLEDGSKLLFNDRIDPDNLNNIAGQHPAVVNAMGAAINEWFNNSGPILGTNELNGTAAVRATIPVDSPEIYRSGNTFTLYTPSESIWLKFANLSNSAELDVLQNEQYAKNNISINNNSFVEIKADNRITPGSMIRYDITVTGASNPDLTGLKLKDALSLFSEAEVAPASAPIAPQSAMAPLARIAVQPEPTELESFEAWQDYYNLPGPVAEVQEADTDGDGLPNYMEYILKTSPHVSDQGVVALTERNGIRQAVLELGMGSDRASYTLHISNSLDSGWKQHAAINVIGSEDETVYIPVETYGEPLYFKLAVEEIK